ncbi:hypothetical protein M8C21_002729, partial [Ambrosia artemisiifolia]
RERERERERDLKGESGKAVVVNRTDIRSSKDLSVIVQLRPESDLEIKTIVVERATQTNAGKTKHLARRNEHVRFCSR